MTIRIDDHLRRMPGAVLIAYGILTSKELIARFRQTSRSSQHVASRPAASAVRTAPREDLVRARAGTESWYFGRRPYAGPGDELRERRYSYKRGIKCQPTLARLLLGD
jgi:hypothetical protein